MANIVDSFGAVIAAARKALMLSQKDLAAKILREDEASTISPQYLNDIEHDRRSPGADHIIKQFARELDLSEDYLFFLANRIPANLRQLNPSPEQVDRAVVAFRRTIEKGKN